MSNVKTLSQYPTPVWVAEAIVERYFPNLDSEDLVLEPSCGRGHFLSALPDGVEGVGVEIDPVLAEEARLETGRRILTGDFTSMPIDFTPTAILGNPPFKMSLIDQFIARSHDLLPKGGRVGFILPAYAFQTPSRVCRWADQWSIEQEMIPRNIYEHLSMPLVFAVFSKDTKRTMVGFALYRETNSVRNLRNPYRAIIAQGRGKIWQQLCQTALERLGGEADLQDIYREIEGNQPESNNTWRDKIRQTLRSRGKDVFLSVGTGRYALAQLPMAA